AAGRVVEIHAAAGRLHADGIPHDRDGGFGVLPGAGVVDVGDQEAFDAAPQAVHGVAVSVSGIEAAEPDVGEVDVVVGDFVVGGIGIEHGADKAEGHADKLRGAGEGHVHRRIVVIGLVEDVTEVVVAFVGVRN